MSHKIFALLFLLLFSVSVYGQTMATNVSDGDQAKRQKDYIDFLRETMVDVSNLRTLENRISFSAELASLMWYYDEREARAMYLSTISDFKELVGQYDLQMKSTVSTADGDIEYYGGMLGEMPERSRITRKFGMAMAVRQQIAMSMAEHDADLAFSFYNESGQLVSSPELRKTIENQDSYFEIQLATQIAETNPAKAVEFASRNLGKGVDYQQIGLLKDIYKKDPDKGAEFAQKIFSSIKTTKSNELYILGPLLEAGSESLEAANKTGVKPMFNEQDLHELSEKVANEILASDVFDDVSYTDSIAKFAPARAAQIRAKLRSETRNANRPVVSNITTSAPEELSKMSDANTIRKQRQEESEKVQKQLADDAQNLGKKELPKEERQKIVDQARLIIARTPGRDKKIAALSMLAASVVKAGDKELAAGIMKDARALVNPDPKNAQDFLLTWMLASGYAESDPDRAFPLLDDTISRLNETIAAFAKAAEFIDTADEIMQDGEVQVGAFGGSMIGNMTKNLGIAEGTIKSLAKADFGKTKSLTNKFDRAEVRILAKMLVLRAVLRPTGQGISEPAKPMTDSPDF
jgi:hypothetical protein